MDETETCGLFDLPQPEPTPGQTDPKSVRERLAERDQPGAHGSTAWSDREGDSWIDKL